MFDKPIVLLKLKECLGETVTLCNKTTNVEYQGVDYVIKIQPIIKDKNLIFPDVEKYVWLIYVKCSDETMKMIAYSRKVYEYDPQLMEKDAFEFIQKIASEIS